AALDAQVDAAQRLDAAVALAYAPQLEHPSFVSLRRRRLPRRLGALAHRGSVAQFVIMESGDAAPTAAQAEWMRLGYGMFVHFGPWTWSGQGDGKFPAAEVHAPALDIRAWARLVDRPGPYFEDDARYAQYMRDQIDELLGYGDLVELWFDGAWDKDHPTRDWPHDPTWPPATGARWEWARLYEHIHRRQPRCLV